MLSWLVKRITREIAASSPDTERKRKRRRIRKTNKLKRLEGRRCRSTNSNQVRMYTTLWAKRERSSGCTGKKNKEDAAYVIVKVHEGRTYSEVLGKTPYGGGPGGQQLDRPAVAAH